MSALDEFLTIDPTTRLAVMRRRPRWRPGNGTAFMARALAVRAVRAAGAHHLLRGRPAIVGLLLEHESDAPSFALQAAELLRATERPDRRGDWRVVNWCAGKKRLAIGLPPEKWSSLMYGFWPFGGLSDAEEEARA